MKTIILIISLAIFGNISYAQNTECTCKSKGMHKHKSATVKKRVPAKRTSKIAHTKSKPVLKNCPVHYDCVYDSATGNVQSIIKNSYSGHHPDVTIHNPYRTLAVGSTAFDHYGDIPAKYSCTGTHASPPLTVRNIPTETESLAIIMYDTHASEKGAHTYWMVWNVDTTGNIPENYVNNTTAMNAANKYGYQAICPVAGTHYYHFAVYALDTKLRVDNHVSKDHLENVMKDHILAKGELIGTYNKHVE